jgi:hypothetical protein
MVSSPGIQRRYSLNAISIIDQDAGGLKIRAGLLYWFIIAVVGLGLLASIGASVFRMADEGAEANDLVLIMLLVFFTVISMKFLRPTIGVGASGVMVRRWHGPVRTVLWADLGGVGWARPAGGFMRPVVVQITRTGEAVIEPLLELMFLRSWLDEAEAIDLAEPFLEICRDHGKRTWLEI